MLLCSLMTIHVLAEIEVMRLKVRQQSMVSLQSFRCDEQLKLRELF